MIISISKRLKKLASEIEQLERTSFIGRIKRIRDSLKLLEKEVSEIVKIASNEIRDKQLLMAYERAGTLEHELRTLNLDIEDKKEISTEEKQALKESRDSAKRILDALDNFYKLHLSPQFNKQGLTGAEINARMNQVKIQYRVFHHVSKKHLPRYCDEFSFRWNNRKVSDGKRTTEAIKGMMGKRLQYSESVKPS